MWLIAFYTVLIWSLAFFLKMLTLSYKGVNADETLG